MAKHTRNTLRLAVVVALTLIHSAPAKVAIDSAAVGNAGNAPDASTGFGVVEYDYRIAKYETSISQYAEFLNAVAKSDPYSLYHTGMASALVGGITRSGASGSYVYSVIAGSGNKPISYVSWFDAARFCNWLHNGQPTGAQTAATTEDGAYALLGVTSGTDIVKRAGAKVWIPTEAEWYKAAYYDPTKGGTGGYWAHANQSNTLTSNTIGAVGAANYFDGDFVGSGTSAYPTTNALTVGGAFGATARSYYGTYDQAGNVWEWNDTVSSGGSRGLRGGCFNNTQGDVSAVVRNGAAATSEDSTFGFRVALVTVPAVPVATTLAATARTESGATLNGVVNAAGTDVAVAFEYGLTTGYGSTLQATPAAVSGVDFTAVSASASGLPSGLIYHYRVVVSGSAGTYRGVDMTFKTTTIAPVAMTFVTIGNPGNAADPADGDAQVFGTQNYGAVAAVYRIGKYEVTNSQYATFLNSVDPGGLNPNDIYKSLMGTARGGIAFTSGAGSGEKYSTLPNMANKPVNFVTWYDAARFANWMHNGQGGGSTETGAYTLNGNFGLIVRNAGASVWIPSENEWYKAAYFNPATASYTTYPTRSNSIPTMATATAVGDVANPGTNVANYNNGAVWNGLAGNVTTVGTAGAASAYGTFDQGGNIYEWNDEVINRNYRGRRGGSSFNGEDRMRVSSRGSILPDTYDNTLGFRIAGLPITTPGATTLAATGIGGTGATLNGSVDGNGSSTSVTFEYGLTAAYGGTLAGKPSTVTGSADTGVSAALSGLTPDTVYHFRTVATSAGGTTKGTDMAFTTLSDNAKLAGLALNAGALVPGFAKETTSYLATVPFATAGVAVTPTTDHPAATVKINGATVTSGAASEAINLPVGNTAISTVVTAQDGVTTRAYLVTVTRLPQAFAFNAATDVPVTANGFATGGYPATLALNYAPVPGTILTMVNNTGLGFITGTFANLAQGQRVTLSYGGNSYDFAVSYFGGTGNDLVLQWADTKVAAWGSNSYGQLGDATTISRLRPTLIDASGVLAGKTVVAVADGYLHSMALCADGMLAAWGYNQFGQLGNGGAVPSSVPVAVDRTGALAGKTVAAIAAGPFHNLALCSDGTVIAWGNNNYGQLGDATAVTRRVPVRVNPLGVLTGKQVVAVAAAAYSSFALCDDGTVAAWGYNDEGELGNGTTTTSLVPVAVTTAGVLSGKRVAALAAGQYHTLALCTDGTLVSWGYNNRGQLGNNSTANSSQPVAIGSFGALAGKTPMGISTGAYHSLARCTDGTVAAWGANQFGQLGTVGSQSSPVPVAVSLTAPTQIAAGGSHSLARDADGTLLSWGDNADGQLGDNSTVSRATPAAVDFAAVAADTRVMGTASSSAARHNLALVAMSAQTGKAVRQTNAAIAAAAAGDDLLNVAFGLKAGQFPQPQREGDDFVIRFTQPAEASGIRYGAEWSDTLLPDSWQDVPDTGAGGEHRFAIPAAGLPQGFLRLKVTRE